MNNLETSTNKTKYSRDILKKSLLGLSNSTNEDRTNDKNKLHLNSTLENLIKTT